MKFLGFLLFMTLVASSLGLKYFKRGPPLDVLFKQAREQANNKSLQVVNGQEVTPHSVPFQVLAGFDDGNGGGWSCGGVLITIQWVLTAGHCVYGSVRSDIILGVHDMSKTEPETRQTFSTYDIFYHEHWDYWQDIGMVKISGAILNQYVGLVELPSANIGNLVGQTATVIGWGLINGINPTSSAVLRSGQVSIVDIAQCSLEAFEKDDICTMPINGQGPCSGDSGGPLIVNNIIVGVVSTGPPNCDGGPFEFTRVTGYLDWIQNLIKTK